MTTWSETELAALKRAYASGTLRVSYDGKSVEYGSAEDLLGRIRTIERELAHLNPLVMAGLLGGFTTFSAFSLEAVTLWERGAMGEAALYVGLSVGLSIGALMLGAALARGALA